MYIVVALLLERLQKK